MVDFTTGVGLGLKAGVEQTNVEARRKIQERQLGIQEDQLQFQQQKNLQEQIVNNSEQLREFFVKAKEGSGLTTAQFNEQVREPLLRQAEQLNRISEKAGLPALGDQLIQAVEGTSTATEAAASKGTATATERISEAQALTLFGIPTAQALSTAGVAEAEIPKLQTEIGQLIQDQELVIEKFGENSPQAQAIGEVIAAKQAGETKPDFSDISGLRKEFTAASKDFVKTQDAFDRVKFAAENPSAAGDLALIFGFMKMLDPASTVREGEFANAQNAAGVPDQVVNIYNRALEGTRLNERQREDFFNQTKRIFRGQLQRQIGREENFGGIADSFGFDRNQVLIDFREGVTVEDIRISEPAETQEPLAGSVDLDETLNELKGMSTEQARERLRQLPIEQRRALLKRLQGGN